MRSGVMGGSSKRRRTRRSAASPAYFFRGCGDGAGTRTRSVSVVDLCVCTYCAGTNRPLTELRCTVFVVVAIWHLVEDVDKTRVLAWRVNCRLDNPPNLAGNL